MPLMRSVHRGELDRVADEEDGLDTVVRNDFYGEDKVLILYC
jgi:hypothetical protein